MPRYGGTSGSDDFLLTMFDFQKPNGYISSVISADSGPLFASSFHAQPYLAQNTAIYFSLTGETVNCRQVRFFGSGKAFLLDKPAFLC